MSILPLREYERMVLPLPGEFDLGRGMENTRS